MKRIVVDVDTQFDFVDPSGALYVEAPRSVPQAIDALLAEAQGDGSVVIGSVDSHAYDAWEFEDNGGPFPAHCVKGRRGWMRVASERPSRCRFLPMQSALPALLGETVKGEGARCVGAEELAIEALSGVGLYFEKEVYSLFSNPVAEPIVAGIVDALGGPDAVCFEVVGYCTGGYCVDEAALGLVARGYRVKVLGFATAAIGGAQGIQRSRESLGARGVTWVETR